MLNIYRTHLSATALLPLLSAFMLCAAQTAPSAMSNDQAARILTESAWSKKVEAVVLRPLSGGMDDSMGGSRGAGMGASADAGAGDSMGSGGGGGGRGGRGGRGGGGGQVPMAQTHPVMLRWESALPVRQALELTNRKLDAASSSEHASYYSIAALIPGARIGKADPEQFVKILKEKASLKIRGKKISPERVDISARADGMIVYFLFPRSEAITAADKDVEFAALFGPMEIKTKFHPKEMIFGDKLEL